MIYLCITPYFPSATSVIGPFVYDQVRAIERTGRFSRIVVMKPCAWWTRGSLRYMYDHVEVVLFRNVQFPSKILPDFFNRLNRWLFTRRLQQIGVSQTDHANTVVHVHTAYMAKYGVWARSWLGQGPGFWLQHHDLDPLLVRMGRLRRWAWHQRVAVGYRVAYVNEADLQICVSELGLRQLEAFPKNTHTSFRDYDEALAKIAQLPKIRIQHALVLRNGADVRKFFPKLDLEKKRDKFRLGCVAAFNESKGQMTLICAVHQILLTKKIKRDVIELIFVGIGPFREACEKYVLENGLNDVIHFESVKDHRALLPLYQSLDLFVLASVFETFACVYLEAFSCGVPFICCSGQGNAESIPEEDYEKWIVEPDNVDQLAKRIEAFYINRYSQRLTHEYNIDVLVGKFLDSAIKITSSRGAHCVFSHEKTN